MTHQDQGPSEVVSSTKVGQSSKEPLHADLVADSEPNNMVLVTSIFGGDSDLSELEDDDDDFFTKRNGDDNTSKDEDLDSGGDTEHPGPFTSRESALDTINSRQNLRHPMIGTGIQRPLEATNIRTYSRRRVSRNGGQSGTIPNERVNTATVHSDSESSSLTALTSTPQKNGQKRRDTRNFPLVSKRKREGMQTLDGSLQPISNSKRRKTLALDNPSPESRERVSPGRAGNKRSAALSTPVSGRPRRNSLPVKVDSWTLETLGKLVWIRIDSEGHIVDDKSKESYWWPAKVTNVHIDKMILTVLLYSPLDSDSEELILTVRNPSPFNILSFSQHKFDENTFRIPPRLSSLSTKKNSKFKKLQSRWKEAYLQFSKEDKDVDLIDGFPSSTVALLSQTTCVSTDDDSLPNTSTSPVAKFKTPKIKSKSSQIEGWNPPLPDPDLRIPGELILAKWGSQNSYWPAQLLEYVKPEKPGKVAKYRVRYGDGWIEHLTRDQFFIYEQDEFASCKVGEFESVETLHGNDELEESAEVFATLVNERLEVPNTLDPPPVVSRYIKLSTLQQFAYIVPILKCALRAEYKPCQDRIEAFLIGGRKRQGLLKQAPEKGTLTRMEYGDLLRLVIRWAFGLETASSSMTQVSTVSQRSEDLKGGTKPSSPPPGADVQQSSEQPLPIESSLVEKLNSDQHEGGSSVAFPPSVVPPSTVATDSPSCTPEGVANEDHQVTIIDSKANVGEEQTHATASTAPDDSVHKVHSSFRDLPVHDKIHYCIDVLAHVAVVQILLWRYGERTSLQLLSDEEEKRLYDIGHELARQVDFVHEVQQLRETKIKLLETKQPLKEQNSNRGTRSRPKY